MANGLTAAVSTIRRKQPRAAIFTFTAALLVTVAALLCCDRLSARHGDAADGDEPPYRSYKDIPGVTEGEIAAIEAIKKRLDGPFVYGALRSTEAFVAQDGEVRGFAARVCDYMSALFGIRFKPELYEWDDLAAKLESGAVDFTGEWTPTEERRKNSFMTDGVAERLITTFTIAGGKPLNEIAKTRPLRYGFLEGAPTVYAVLAALGENAVQHTLLPSRREAYDSLKSGAIDAFLDENVAMAAFDEYGDVADKTFLPFTCEQTAISTRNPALEPVISVMQKAIRNGGRRYLAALYNTGLREYRANRMFAALTEEEKEYIKNGHAVAFAAEFDNYPISFYNTYEREWQGIAFDVLREIEALTGIAFTIANDRRTNFSELMNRLEGGEVSVISELIRSKPREGRFLWPQTPILIDKYVLISKMGRRNISINEISYMKIGVQEGTAYHEMFNIWFPNHANTVIYGSVNELLDAVERDEIDMAMASQHQLLCVTNYMERPGYKANLIFDDDFESHLGFNANERVLCSIVDKSLHYIDVHWISDLWMHKTYDYRAKLAHSLQPLLFSMFALLLCVIGLLLVLFRKNRSEERRLNELVQKRTTDLERLQRELEDALNTAHAANRAKSIFLANVSHEIRTPMNAIIGMSELALRGPLNGEAREQVSTIRQAGTNLLSIINDILDISKIESGRMEIVPVHYLFASLTGDVASIIRARITNPHVKFTENIDPTIPKALFGDEARVRQILLNLLTNAVKYTAKGFVSLTVKCEPAGKNGVVLTIEVADSGKGIREEDVGRLFESFVQIDLVDNKGIEGTGLGLAITWNLVKAMGGNITVKSEYGKGSAFTVTLPQKVGNEESIAAQVSSMATFTAPEARVLIVDDIATNLKVAEGLLQPYKMQVDTRKSGAEAIEAAANETYDLIFMDHMMPEMDGMEAARQIRALPGGRCKKTPIIALTANAVSGMRETFLNNRMDDFLSKPIDTRKLNAILEKWIPKEKQAKLTKEEAEAAGVSENTSAANIAIDGVDVRKGIAMMGGKAENYMQTLAVFGRDGRDKTGEIRKALAAGDLKLYTIYVHALKSASANIGATGLSESARALEAAGKENNRAFIDSHNDALLSNLESILDGIDNCLKSANANRAQQGAEVDAGAMKADLIKLKTSIDTMNVSAINEAVRGLKHFTADATVDNILQNTLIGEYDEAVVLIDKLLDS